MPDDGIVVGRLIANRYVIEQPCERSTGSAIYRARHLPLDRTVLLRVLPGRGEITRARCREAMSLAERVGTLPTPHVARTLDVGVVAERWPFVVSEYSRGKSLAAVVAQQGPLGLARVLPIARQLASVLALAHSANVRHGDLLLSGVWVESPRGRPDWIRMLDFGVCELPTSEGPTSQSGVFQSSFRRPEAGSAFSRDAERWDVRAFGAALYELALGSTAHSTSDLPAVFDAQLHELGGSSERARIRALAQIVERCLVPMPEVTYHSMDEVCRDLEIIEQMAATAPLGRELETRAPMTSIHAPARRAQVAIGGPKVIVRAG